MKINLLIADDEYFILKRLEKVISQNRKDIEISALCEDGEDVIKMICLKQIDILLMDIKMIKVSGLEVAKYVYENKLDIKIIIISGYNDFDYAISAMRYGVFDYLSKPLSEEDLFNSLDKCIIEIYDKKNTKNKFDIKNSLSIFFKNGQIYKTNKDISQLRSIITKYLSISDKKAYKHYIITNINDIINNYNYISLYKFIIEIIISLDIKYHILNNISPADYIENLILSSNIKTIDNLSKTLINLGFDCMQLNQSSSKEELIIKEIFLDIEKNFSDTNYCVSKIAKNLNKNSSYLNYIFKKNQKITIVSYLNNYRLDNAKKLLKSKNLKISEVATQCGYLDTFYFSKKFKARFGYPPSEENLKL